MTNSISIGVENDGLVDIIVGVVDVIAVEGISFWWSDDDDIRFERVVETRFYVPRIIFPIVVGCKDRPKFPILSFEDEIVTREIRLYSILEYSL